MKTDRYSSTIKKHETNPNYLKNMAMAFICGGTICLIGQTLVWIYTNQFNVEQKDAGTYMIVTMILVSTITTGLGVYDKFGHVAKAGGFIPITGFANSLTSSALEGKSERLILGIFGNMFKLAGTSIVVAVVAGFFFGILRYMLMQLGFVEALDESVTTYLGVFL